MSGFLAKAKNTAIITKIKGEIALLDREEKQQRQAFGVELYDLLDSMYSKSGWDKMPHFLGKESQQIKQIFDVCQLDIRQLLDSKDAKEREVEHLQIDRERALPPTTNKEKLAQAGKWMSSQGNEAKLKAESALLDHKMKARKGTFGIDVFSLVTGDASAESILGEDSSESSSKGGILSGVKSGISNQISKLSGDEKKIQDIIKKAMADDALIQQRKERKRREIARLEQEIS
ncbi:hypothetical protein FisN_7Hh184 [Fistulifera solaris]|uniref:Uncharacterized protein n=1 Tax=Fistulifera solaris TaxID=1519565 RepID=A0A1Z5K3T7_FISSO|nr:hypothetical protein FisN_7Hh184 [Fistulifera solaris]|eukprot:GAX20866.1 hypothetical protein FisN_7Hh184 [Fistulifera solaris]